MVVPASGRSRAAAEDELESIACVHAQPAAAVIAVHSGCATGQCSLYVLESNCWVCSGRCFHYAQAQNAWEGCLAFITDEEVAGLRIENMILHVVSDEGFTEQSARVVEHADFFIERIRNTDIAPVFAFDAASQTKRQLERMAREEDTFELGGQALSREFARLHPGSSRDGAFFIFELRTNDPAVRIYSLIKYDYQQVIEQQERDGGNLLRLIVQAFVADKRAIQKAALVRVVDGSAEIEVAARDRMKQAPEIGDYSLSTSTLRVFATTANSMRR